VIGYCPAKVATKMISKEKPDHETITAAMAADVAFRDLGYD